MSVEIIGKQIASLRKEKGVKQEELAKYVGVSTQAVSKWENGGVPDIELLPKIWAYAKAISEWEAEHREEWKNVIVYDAAILCDWINSELAVAAWLFEIYDKGAHPIAISSISRAWRGFSKWADPAFTYVMFTEGREEQRAQLMAYCKERQICCVSK